MFTIFGATGNTGSHIAARLLAAHKPVRAVVRDAAKARHLQSLGAELVVGDLTDAALIHRALENAHGAYLLAPPDLASPDLLAKNRAIIDHFTAALSAHKTPHAVFLSSVGAQHASGTGPSVFSYYGENTLPKASHTRFTFMRAPYFMENLLGNAHPMKTDGVLPVFGGNIHHPLPMIATRDIADASADALLSPPTATEWVELHGPRTWSYADAAAIVSKLLGRTVTATPVPIEAMVPTMMKFGASESVAKLFREMTEAAGRGVMAYEGKGRTVRRRMGAD